MRFVSKVRMMVIGAALCASAMGQQKINPNTGINWPQATGAGTPTAMSVACGSTNYGQLYTDTAVTPNTFYTCGNDGWAIRGGGQGPAGPTGPTGPTGPAGPAAVLNGPVYMFGTSITAGTGSVINGNSYVDILATDSGNNLQAWGIGGAQSADITEQVVRKFPKNSTFRLPLGMGEVFSNDAQYCGDTAGCLANGSEDLNAIIGWVTIPSGGVIDASSATSSGFAADTTTFQDTTLPAIGMKTTTQNSTLTFNFTNAGTQVGLMFAACDAFTSAQFTVTLGSTVVDTISPIGNDGQAILTHNGATCTFYRKEYANTNGATVSLTVTKTDATTTSAGTVSIWDADTNGAGLNANSPNFWTLGTIMTNGNTNAAATAAFDTLSQTVANQFTSDGWNSLYIPMRAGQTGANPGVNDSTDMQNLGPVNPNEAVGYHPNSGPGGGHFHYAMTIENFATANNFSYFNQGVSGNHNFFAVPIVQTQNYAPANILGYNNFNTVGSPSTTGLNPGGLLTSGTIPPNGAGTYTGIDLGYDPTISSYVGRAFGSNYYEICPLSPGIQPPTNQAAFACGHDLWWSNGDFQKPFGFFRPKGGISYENQTNNTGVSAPVFNPNRGINVNYISTALGPATQGLVLCKANTYDYQVWFFKSTGDTNPVTFTAYNNADNINGIAAGATGTITAYSIASDIVTFTATNTLVNGNPVYITGFPTSTFLNLLSGIVQSASSTSFAIKISHANVSTTTETGQFQINAYWTGMASPYSAALVQCSLGPTGNNTIQIAQFTTGVTNAAVAMKYQGTTTATTSGTSDTLSVTNLTSSNHCSAQATNTGASALTGVYTTPGAGSVTLHHSAAVGGETFDLSCNVP
jgi:hypothetical protein